MWRLIAVLCALCACNGKTANQRSTGAAGDTSRDRNLSTDDLSRELEIVILENYLQLSVGNIEAYADSISREREVMLLGLSADATRVGRNQELARVDRRPLKARPRCMPGERTKLACLTVLSKRLDVHLYADDSAGWLSDELSYRVPIGGRLATIPLRLTAVFVRDIDRWILVSEHLSYALPLSEIMDLARTGELSPVRPYDNWFSERGRAKLLRDRLERQFNESEKETTLRSRQLRSKYRRAREERAEGQDTNTVREDAMVVIRPTPGAEYHDEQVHDVPSLARVFGAGARVRIDNYRFDMAANARVAWMAANLTAEARDPESGRPVRIGLRGTFLFAFDKLSGWNLMQSHVSVPISDTQLADRIFGPLPEAERKSDDGEHRPPRR